MSEDVGPRIGDMRVLDPVTGEPKTAFRPGQPLGIELLLADGPPQEEVEARVELLGPAELLVSAYGPVGVAGRGVRFTVLALPPLRGTFTVAATLRDPATGATCDAHRLRDAIQVDGAGTAGILQVPWSVSQPHPAPAGSRSADW